VAPPLRVPPDSRVLADVLQLLINQGESLRELCTPLLALMTWLQWWLPWSGELFASCGLIFLHPDYVTQLLKPLVDHRVSHDCYWWLLIAMDRHWW